MSGAQPQPTRLVAGEGQFLLDGKPLQIISGEMHYPRIPREYWRDRFKMARAMGLNTISTYVFWNLHEPTPGKFDFSGNNNVAEFVREAACLHDSGPSDGDRECSTRHAEQTKG